MFSRILITGGAGFVGSSLALALKARREGAAITAFDNLRRRGSELAVPRLRAAGVRFVHGDVRAPDDLASAAPFDLLIECAAEPSVHAGSDGDAAYVTHTNLFGTANCLEAARRAGAAVIFLSTSRVYPIQGLRSLPLRRGATRLDLHADAAGEGWSARGIAESFPLAGPRSLYGATKLASELLIEEYRMMYGMRAIVNRCGVIAGPWQMGKVDQGVVVLWAARHLFGGQLSYTGFEGDGLQVRDVLHIDDLADLIEVQAGALDRYDGSTFNVGGGAAHAVSLRELTELCRERAGRTLAIGADPRTSAADVPYYISDNTAVTAATGWRPSRPPSVVLDDVFTWLRANRQVLMPLLAASDAPAPAPAG